MYGSQLHIPIWPKRFRGGRWYWHHENYTDRIVTKAQADKMNRHYNRTVKEGVTVHE